MAPASDTSASTAGSSWRDVSIRTYKRANIWSSLFGTLIFAWGLWRVAHFDTLFGIALIVVGSVVALWTALLRVEGMPAALYDPRKAHQAQAARGPHAAGAADAPRGAAGSPAARLWAPRVIHFYTREGCTLCREARTRLEHDLAGSGITIIDHDIDKDPVLAARYSDRVPVAVFHGSELFALGYDPDAVHAARAERSFGADRADTSGTP